MPRYYFNIYNGTTTFDDEGQNFTDRNEACDAAVKAARELICEDIRSTGGFTLAHRIVVTDVCQTALETVLFEDAVSIR